MPQQAMAWSGDSLYHGGNEVLRYGTGQTVAFWSHGGIRKASQPTWYMDIEVGHKIPPHCEALYVAYEATSGDVIPVYRVDKESLLADISYFDGNKQHGARSTDSYVRYVGPASDVLSYELAPCGRDQGDYHVRRNEA